MKGAAPAACAAAGWRSRAAGSRWAAGARALGLEQAALRVEGVHGHAARRPARVLRRRQEQQAAGVGRQRADLRLRAELVHELHAHVYCYGSY